MALLRTAPPTIPGKCFCEILTRMILAALTPHQRDYGDIAGSEPPAGPPGGPTPYSRPLNPTGPGGPGERRPPGGPTPYPPPNNPTGPGGPTPYPPPDSPTGPGGPGGRRPPGGPSELYGMPIPPPPTGPTGPGAEVGGRRPPPKWINPPLGSAADFVFRPFFPPMRLLPPSRPTAPPVRMFVRERAHGPGYGDSSGRRGSIQVEQGYY